MDAFPVPAGRGICYHSADHCLSQCGHPLKCPECGFENLAELARCQQCGWRLAVMPARAAGVAEKPSATVLVLERGPSTPRADVALAEPDPQAEAMVWRQEVRQRVRAYRARRRQHIEGQEDFPFAHGEHESDPGAARVVSFTPRPRRREADRIELPIVQATLAFEDADPEPRASLAPPAAVVTRAQAGLRDVAVVFASYAAFFALFAALGQELPLTKPGLAIYAIILVFFFSSYLFLFTAFGGRTPGMRLMGLEVIRFDGAAPTFGDSLWRTAGYLISAGSFFLGFIWVFVDDRQLTWHDRISKTFIIAAR